MNNISGKATMFIIYGNIILVRTDFYLISRYFISMHLQTLSSLINVASMYKLPDASFDFSFFFYFLLHQPAQIAGCGTVVLATPPSQDGSICKVFDLHLHASVYPVLG